MGVTQLTVNQQQLLCTCVFASAKHDRPQCITLEGVLWAVPQFSFSAPAVI